jgi:hypothetical protein
MSDNPFAIVLSSIGEQSGGALSVHQFVELQSGDDWQFIATMVDPNGSPIDLSQATIRWTLLDRFGRKALGEGDYSVSVADLPTGSCTVLVPATSTSRLGAGVFQDWWRVTIAGYTQTLLTGDFLVASVPYPASPSGVLRLIAKEPAPAA